MAQECGIFIVSPHTHKIVWQFLSGIVKEISFFNENHPVSSQIACFSIKTLASMHFCLSHTPFQREVVNEAFGWPHPSSLMNSDVSFLRQISTNRCHSHQIK
jgi:hypothetical protein